MTSKLSTWSVVIDTFWEMPALLCSLAFLKVYKCFFVVYEINVMLVKLAEGLVDFQSFAQLRKREEKIKND